MITYTSVESVREQVNELFTEDATNALADGTKRLTYPGYYGFSSTELLEKIAQDLTSQNLLLLSTEQPFQDIVNTLHTEDISGRIVVLDFYGPGNRYAMPKHELYAYTENMKQSLTPKLLIVINYTK